MQLKQEIEDLNQMVLKMCALVQRNIKNALDIYKGEDVEMIVNDDIVDQYERMIDEICLDILIKERPWAKDLREIMGIIKLTTDLERIADHAEDILGFNNELKKIKTINNIQIDDIVSQVLKMIDGSIQSFVKKDLKLASNVIKMDDYIDTQFLKIVEELKHININTKDALPFAIYSTLVIKYIERIADHAVNIAEWTTFIVNGYLKDTKIY